MNSNIMHPAFAEANMDMKAAITRVLKLRAQRDRLAYSIRRQGGPVQSGPQIRARDDKQWIKKDNRYTGGIRKQRFDEVHKKTGMAKPLTEAQHQRHSIHLMSRVLDLRTAASPFTLVIDDLGQRALPLTTELMRRALSRNINVIYLAFEAKNAHPSVRFIPAWGSHTGDQILAEVERALKDYKESIVIVDSLYDLVTYKNINMNAFFNLVAMKYCSTLVGVYHQDLLEAHRDINPYNPHTLDVIKYMATTLITCKSFAHALAAKAAKARSLPQPSHGLLQGAEGIVQCLKADDSRGIVLEAEFRRKSGRPEFGTYFLRPARHGDYNEPLPGMTIGTLKKEFVILLDMVPAYASPEVIGLVDAAGNDVQSTFNLALTAKQKQAREGVVLPYFDAQKSMGQAGEGGRILYDMGSEDDFDDEEDEI